MPVVDGLEWYGAFREGPSRPTTPVAIVTGNYLIADATVEDLRCLGAVVKFKPLWAEDLVAITQTLMEA
jgi:hypothetical protein